MGTRLSVWPEGRMNEEVGDDHKLYFYQPWGNVSLSFRFLFNKVLRYDPLFEIYTRSPNTARDAYNFACGLSGIGPYTLSEDDFREFAKLYLLDFMKAFPDSAEDYARVAKYMHDMSETNGNKVVDWG